MAIALGLSSEPAAAQFRGCDVDDVRCLDDHIFQYCVEPQATAATCQALAEDLQAQQSISETAAIGTTLGTSFYNLARWSDDDADEARYLARARQTLLDVVAEVDVVAEDDAVAEAYVALAVVDADFIEARIDWLRQLVAIDPKYSYIGIFSSALSELRTPEAYAEAMDTAIAAYDRAAPGSDKWLLAGLILGYYQSASRRDPGTFELALADEFVARVREDSNWDWIVQVASDPAQNPALMHDALETACHLIRVFGEEVCMRGVETTVQAAIRSPDSSNAQVLADAAAFGAMAAPPGGGPLSPDTRRPWLAGWMEELLDSRLDSLVVLDAVASISPEMDRRFEVRREIVLRNPNSGQARFDLAQQHFNRDEWEPARIELELASEMLPPDDELQWLVRQYLRTADYEIRSRN
jgi:tetratricopeptide (TPR) repeat protein